MLNIFDDFKITTKYVGNGFLYEIYFVEETIFENINRI